MRKPLSIALAAIILISAAIFIRTVLYVHPAAPPETLTGTVAAYRGDNTVLLTVAESERYDAGEQVLVHYDSYFATTVFTDLTSSTDTVTPQPGDEIKLSYFTEETGESGGTDVVRTDSAVKTVYQTSR
ncbi:MAG: hypothetical protein QM689_10745 [Oscillospiraceae bacterium]